MREEQRQIRVTKVPFWFHSIDMGDGLVSPGVKPQEQLKREWESMELPALSGKSVLDINSWDGFFAFEAEERGATKVTALDRFMWTMHLDQHMEYWQRCKEEGRAPEPYETRPYYDPESLPGKIGFDTAHALRESGAASVVGDFMDMDLAEVGEHDVVFFLGSLYHMEDPLRSLRRVASVTSELAIIETEAAEFPGHHDRAVCEFFPGSELNGDPSNWWAPNAKALTGMCRAAGFTRVELVSGPPGWSRSGLMTRAKNLQKTGQASAVSRYRATVQAWK